MAKLNLKKIQAKAKEIKEREKKRKEQGNADSAFVNKIPVGLIEVRVLPPWSDAGELAKEIWTHFKLPPGGTTVVDIANTHPKLGLENPIAEVLEDFADDLDVTRLKSKPTPKINVYFPDSDINQENDELSETVLGKVKILSPSVGVFNQIVKMIGNPRIGDITDAEEGFNITIEKTVGAKWQDTRYDVQLCPRPSPIHEDPDEQERILEKTWDLDKMFPAPDDGKVAEFHTVANALRKHLEKQLREIGGAPKRRTRLRSKQEAEPEEEEEEAPPAPAKKKRSRKAEPEAAESEAENFDDGEAEEAPPRSKKKATKKKKRTAKAKPECFGDADVYKVDAGQYETCNACIWEIPCMQNQKKAGTFTYEE